MHPTLRLNVLVLIVFGFFVSRPLGAQEVGEVCLQPIRLDEGNSAILGTVVDDNKRPVAGVEIYAIGGEGGVMPQALRSTVPEPKGGGAPPVSVTLGTTESGESGEFLIIVPFTGTQIRIRATRWGFSAAEQSVTVGNRQILKVEIVLHRRAGVTTQGTPNTAMQTIYFVTDRARRNVSDPETVFGTRRSDHVYYGVATVAVPAPTPPQVMPFGVTLRFMDNPNLDTKLEKLSETPSFWKDIRAAMDGLKSKDVYVFVHGYDNTFDSGARRAALIAYAAHLPGPTILYSWPSQGSVSKYTADETNIKWTQVHFHSFLDELARQTDARINLVAHSMGNRAVLDALEYFVHRGSQPRFGEVILAAPDVDHDTYRDMVQEIADTVEHVTLYGSTNDQAIRLSKGFHGYSRAGDGGQGIPVVTRQDKRVDAIDASAVPADLMGHAYLETKDILIDVQAVTEHKYPKRNHLTPSANGEGGYWIFNP